MASLSVAFASPASAANLLSNTATANGTPAGGTLTPPTDTVDVDVVNKSNSMTLAKTVSSITTANGANAAAIDALDVITYQYVITNTGNQTLTAVAPTDTGPTFDGTAGTNTLSAFSPASVSLAPGASQTFTATYVLSQADVDNAVGVTDGVSNTASATGTDPQSVTVNPACATGCTATATIPNVSSMTVAKSLVSVTTANGANATQTDSGDVITYQYVVTNTGNTTLTGVLPTDAGPTFNANAATNALDTSSWVAATLAPGASQTFNATYTLAQADVDNAAGVTDGVSNTASANGTDPLTNTVTPASSSTAVATIAATPGMSIAKTGVITTDNGTSGEADAGDVITYTYEVTNTGNVTITGVTISDVHGGYGTAPVPGSETGVTVTNGSTDAAANGSWDTLRPGDTIRFTATYTVVQSDVDNLQ
ncbi:MAG: DUF11 domain-containing protein [Notoacmeibacter sp.]|nr:DUF11 domain-containing protein [Notoacmeibacter sp.]